VTLKTRFLFGFVEKVEAVHGKESGASVVHDMCFSLFSTSPGALLGEAAYLPSMVQQQGRPEVFHDPHEWYAQAQAKSVPLGFYFVHLFATFLAFHTHSGWVLAHFKPFQFVLFVFEGIWNAVVSVVSIPRMHFGWNH